MGEFYGHQKEKQFQRFDRICIICGRKCGGRWKYMALSLPGRKGRGRAVPYHIFSAGTDLWIYPSYHRCGHWKKDKAECPQGIWHHQQKMELPGISYLSCAGTDYDLLFRDWWVGHKVYCGLSHCQRFRSGTGRLFYFLYHVQGITGGFYADLFGSHCLYRVPGRGKRN